VTSPYDLQTAPRLEGTPDGAEEQVAETRQCGRCGGVGTHYLTCPALRLPKGYRINDRINDRIGDRIGDRISDPDRRPR
jgi:hypothetical protein